MVKLVVNVMVKKVLYDLEIFVNFMVEVDLIGCLYWFEIEEEWMSEGCKVSIYRCYNYLISVKL